MGPLAKARLVALAVPVVQAEGPLVLLTIIDTGRIQQLLDRERLPEGWSLAIRDSRGDVIASRLPLPTSSSRRSSSDDGVRHEVASKVSRWSVELDTSAPSRTAPLLDAAKVLAAAILVATLTGLLSATLASRRLSRSVDSLADVEPASDSSPGTAEIAEIAAARRRLYRDRAQRRQAEASLARSRAQLTAFIEQAPSCIAMFDGDMNYLATSGDWLRTFGEGHATLVGRNNYEVSPDIPAQWRAVHQAVLGGAPAIRDHADTWRRADGREVSLRWSVVPLSLIHI